MQTRTISELLHDADRAHGGADLAEMIGDTESYNELVTKRNKLISKAKELDPDKVDPAWEDNDLPNNLL